MSGHAVSIPVLVVGAGAWGTAIAAHLAARAPEGIVQLWGRSARDIAEMAATRENKRYLPGISLPTQLGFESDLDRACMRWRDQSLAHASAEPTAAAHGLIILATPMSGLEEAAAAIAARCGAAQPGEGLLWLAKGLRVSGDPTAPVLEWPHQIVGRHCVSWPQGALSGPSFAQEVAQNRPVALTLASQDLQWARAVAQACHGGGMRIYAGSDLLGVELGGAMKNVLAIAAGVCDGLDLGGNARAALLTRGLAEMSRLGVAIGAQPQSFMGLATLGDLILTATGDLSRNRRVGLALARGESLSAIVSALGHVAEGVTTAPALLALAKRSSVEVPITESVCRLLLGEISPAQAITQLMSREPKDEISG
jgi:glycerol-3-phosphate dehydrogenase (NAD(P)+)